MSNDGARIFGKGAECRRGCRVTPSGQSLPCTHARRGKARPPALRPAPASPVHRICSARRAARTCVPTPSVEREVVLSLTPGGAADYEPPTNSARHEDRVLSPQLAPALSWGRAAWPFWEGAALAFKRGWFTIDVGKIAGLGRLLSRSGGADLSGTILPQLGPHSAGGEKRSSHGTRVLHAG
jgi:hypothetical protein